MPRIRAILIATVTAFLLFTRGAMAQPVPADPSGEEVQSFAADIDVKETGAISVTERIDYYFAAPRHGIFRDIPVRYDVGGKTVVIPVDIEGVSAPDGRPITYSVSKQRNFTRVKIGDADVTVTGPQSYVIRYSVEGALRYGQQYPDTQAKHDELYWNVTGSEWQVPLRRVSATVRLPSSVAQDDIRTACYTGPQGSTAQDCVKGAQGSVASFAANGAMTVVVGFPQGVVSLMSPKAPGFLDVAAPFLPLALPVGVAALLTVLWWTRGRDPEGRGTIVVEYDPPKGLTPAECGVMVDEDAGLGDVSAVIVDLAVRGYLKIREIEKKGLLLKSTDYEFERIRDYRDDPALKRFETHLLDALFGGEGKIARVSDIKAGHTFYDDLPKIKQKLYDGLTSDGYFPADPSKIRAAYAGVGIVVLVLMVMFFGPGFLFSGTVFGNTGLGIALSGLAVLLFAPLMPRKTPKGVDAFEHAVGFREYLGKAEKYRMQWQEKENVFEAYLPYAMAFGVVEKWTKAFSGMNVPPPRWYEGRSAFGATGSFNPAAFYGALTAMNGAMSTAMTSRPQQSSGGSGFSSGGGGGFSGGGFGGGGGGSW
ncbi:MAG: hypothetical protein RL272_70 [Candidatus Parcubacteria bacterium]|jgi:uncharacterized membrane protein YgcG